MEDKIEEVLKQYPVRVKTKRRMRGAILLETEEGIRMIRSYAGSRSRLYFEEQVKQCLCDRGYSLVDTVVENLDGELLTRDGAGGRWIMKQWYLGRECDIRDSREVRQASAHLAKLHEKMLLSEEQLSGLGSCEKEAGEGTENKEMHLVTVSEEEDEERGALARTQGSDLFERHNRELKRIHSYIRKKRRKNEMEICLLNSFHHFYEQGCEAQRMCEENGDFEHLLRKAKEYREVVHGSYNYHNIIFQGRQIVTTNFERAEIGIQILDLYDFIRKVMEKNGWKQELGLRMVDAYQQIRRMDLREKRLLYTMLLYPEKYWKQCNFYYNGKKSWMSAKNYEKLQRIQAQEAERIKFLDAIKRLLF